MDKIYEVYVVTDVTYIQHEDGPDEPILIGRPRTFTSMNYAMARAEELAHDDRSIVVFGDLNWEHDVHHGVEVRTATASKDVDGEKFERQIDIYSFDIDR